MSDIVERTLFTVQSFMTGTSSRDSAAIGSKNFQNFVVAVTNAKTGSEQDDIVNKELLMLREQLSHPKLTTHNVKDCLLRAVYSEMLGYPAPFVHVHSIKQAQQGSLMDKRIGYLAATLLLHYNHELVILIVNTIQKDLKSSNILEICMALTATTYLINAEMAATVVDLIEEKLSHPKEMVRKKAVLAVHHFLRINPAAVNHLVPKLKSCLGDSDPEVVAAALHAVHWLVKVDRSSCSDLTQPLVDILWQVVGHKLPVDFDYHGIPGPWLQIQILKTLASIGSGDASMNVILHKVFDETLQFVGCHRNIAVAVAYECISTVAVIGTGDSSLVDKAFAVVNCFLQERNCNVKYVGIKALAHMVRCLPSSLLATHQAVVMECLNHPDSCIKRKTLDVLFALTNSSNIQVVCPRILRYLQCVNDALIREEVMVKLSELVDHYHPNKKWYFEMANSLLLEAGPSILLPDLVQGLKKLMRSNDENMVQEAAVVYLNYLERRQELAISKQLLLVATWTIGHRHSLCRVADSETVFGLLASIADENASDRDVAIGALTAMRKVVIHGDFSVASPCLMLEKCLNSCDCNVQSSAFELKRLIDNIESIRPMFSGKECAPVYDWTLSFLDEYVSDHLKSEGAPYKPRSVRTRSGGLKSGDVSYHDGISVSCGALMGSSVGSSVNRGPASLSSVSTGSDSGSHRFINSPSTKSKCEGTGIPKVWSREGRQASEAKGAVPSTSQMLSSAHNMDTTALKVPEDAMDAVLVKALFGSQVINTDSVTAKIGMLGIGDHALSPMGDEACHVVDRNDQLPEKMPESSYPES